MKELEKELQESIKKNLPQQVGDVLKERLAQADKDSEEVKRLNLLLDNYSKDKQQLENKIITYQKFDERNTLLESREKELEKERNNFEIEKLQYQLLAEKDKTQFSQNVALGLVRNTQYRKTIFDNENLQPYQDSLGNWIYPTSINKHFSETKEEE